MTNASNFLRCDAPAKVNLFLEILGKRPDGYHELATVMTRVNLCDTLTFQPIDFGLELSVASDSLIAVKELSNPRTNLVYRTLERLQQRTGCRQGMRVELIKRIPLQAGLGGASSDAATTLKAANRLWGLGLTPHELTGIGNELGSDIAFFFTSGMALCRGRGELVTPIPMVLNWHLVLVQPPFGLSTGEMFQSFQLARPPESVEQFIEGLESQEIPVDGLALFNRFEELACQRSPWFSQIKAALLNAGAIAAQLTGSGSCYFGVFTDLASANQANQLIARQFPDCTIFTCQTTKN